MSSRHVKVSLSLLMVLNLMIGVPVRSFAEPHDTTPTTSPIKHVIVIIGENRTFDHIFATYMPKKGQTISNLLPKALLRRMAARV